MTPTKAYAAYNPTDPLAPYQFDRRDLRPHDVQIEILYCGVCHSDLHQARNEWDGSMYPMVPGHEIVGKVTHIGKEVTGFKVGELAAVGVMVDSCRACKNCMNGLEQYCVEEMTGTYNAIERDGVSVAQGGYSTTIVTDENYVLHISEKLDLKAVAPLLCAGITTYSPLRYAQVGKGMKVGVIGLGGLGHMGLKFAAAFGAEVTLISHTASKEKDALGLGAKKFLLSTDPSQMDANQGYFNVLLNTVSAPHDYARYLDLLDLDGQMLIVGLPAEKPKVAPFALLRNRRSITGSMIGGIKETQEMLDYCAAQQILPEVELIRMQEINEAYERMLKGDVHYRFVIDLNSLRD